MRIPIELTAPPPMLSRVGIEVTKIYVKLTASELLINLNSISILSANSIAIISISLISFKNSIIEKYVSLVCFIHGNCTTTSVSNV